MRLLCDQNVAQTPDPKLDGLKIQGRISYFSAGGGREF